MGILIELVFSEQAPLAAAKIASEIDAWGNAPLEWFVDHGMVSTTLVRALEWLEFKASGSVDGSAQLPGVGWLPRPSVLVLKGEGHFDIEINFDSDDFSDMDDIVLPLYSYAKMLAERHSLINYYCGFEPACRDLEDRYFTGATWGPLFPKHLP